ncbi:MAG: helix-turn-helix domain-containing protein [Opitutaceae bacterium]
MKTNTPASPALAISLQEAAQQLGVHRRTLEREIQRGRFPSTIRIGRAVRVLMTDFERYMATQAVRSGLVPEWSAKVQAYTSPEQDTQNQADFEHYKQTGKVR